MGKCTITMAHFWKTNNFTSEFYNIKFTIFCGIILKIVIKSIYQKKKLILIWAHVEVPKIFTSDKQNNNFRDLWKYGSIFTIQNSISKIWLQFLREEFHIKVYDFIQHHTLNHYR